MGDSADRHSSELGQAQSERNWKETGKKQLSIAFHWVTLRLRLAHRYIAFSRSLNISDNYCTRKGGRSVCYYMRHKGMRLDDTILCFMTIPIDLNGNGSDEHDHEMPSSRRRHSCSKFFGSLSPYFLVKFKAVWGNVSPLQDQLEKSRVPAVCHLRSVV